MAGAVREKKSKWITPAGLDKIRAWVQDGKTDREIAALIGVHYVTLSNWRRTSDKIRSALYKPDKTGQKDIRDVTRNGRKMAWHIDEIAGCVDRWKREREDKNLPLTITSLICYLHISRDTFDRYIRDTNALITDHYITDIDGRTHAAAVADILKDCNRLCESSLVDRCVAKNSVGAMFILKNHHGYQDKQTIEADKGPINVTWGAPATAPPHQDGGNKSGLKVYTA